MEKDKSTKQTNQQDEIQPQVEIREGYQPSDTLDTSSPPNSTEEHKDESN